MMLYCAKSIREQVSWEGEKYNLCGGRHKDSVCAHYVFKILDIHLWHPKTMLYNKVITFNV